MIRHRLRLRFRKRGNLRYIGHRDLLRTLERLFRRAGLQLSMTQGFHPKPRLSFPLALAVGIASQDEVMQLELAQEMTGEEVLAALAPECPAGLEFTSAEVVPEGSKKAPVKRVVYELPIPAARQAELQQRIDQLLEESSHEIRRLNRDAPIDARKLIDQLVLEDGTLQMCLHTPPEGGLRPGELLGVLGVEDLIQEGCFLTRTAVQLET